MQIIMDYWWTVVVIGILVLYIIRTKEAFGKALTNKDRETGLAELRQLAYQLMLAAEKTFEGQDVDGSTKFKLLLEMYNKLCPEELRHYITEEDLAGFLQKQYNQFKDFLDDGIINDSITMQIYENSKRIKDEITVDEAVPSE